MEAWVNRLLAWYAANKRQMPWRGHPDAYAVWVSEIMLQQTQVDTVRPYFIRFLKSFPTIEALANAEDEPLLKAWEGLGYYTRVRNLRKAAQKIFVDYGGVLPSTVEALLTLPGVGRYTAAAIASIAFGLPEPVVDGNVARVFARMRGLNDDFSKEAPRRTLAAWLKPHIEASNAPADFNQAMMELGALVCTPKKWRCDDCPLAPECHAKQRAAQANYPFVPKAKALPIRKQNVLLLRATATGEILFSRHPGDRLLAGFWELPQLTDIFTPLQPKHAFLYKQTFSHFHLRQTVYTATVDTPFPPSEGQCWAAVPSALPLTTATRKILQKLPPPTE